MVTLIQWMEMGLEERRSFQVFGYNCISDQEDYDCYGKPCACMVCRHEDNFCIDGDPCYVCSGKNNDRALDFCNPDD